ncbi:NAD(P)/FAD-dependent oxidoreductase [Marinobacter orientalis]|uniref:NAD(P)/FAD-dependent oxidoreductase n=1 Tax=Marinobacter orientalis TaxID=1928859 RepID=A0A7Y0RFU8_9GAMM|nr:NAD(P)/FAD-dependent oxidoreductase [Marinobacter orientalis]NMT65443.1 NAD(P)/FAD-dependent oxidoreductase [Marinobacter orientalis]TGX47347.1 NAD(P)/FAD-dependent oxidoreductase [Marinobacter orientalis]
MTDREILQTDTVVIGAGIVGLAVARKLAMQGGEVLVLEASGHFGEGLSSRNSEVIHAGIYYPDNSVKARLCVRGRHLLYDFCRQRHIGHRKTGKWIVARGQAQQDTLANIGRQAGRNGVELQRVTRKRLKEALPGVAAEEALYSPQTGIVDSHGVMVSLLGELEDHGGQLVCHAPVEHAVSDGRQHRLWVGGQAPCELVARRVVNAAGLEAVPLATHWHGAAGVVVPQQWLARGVYFSYSGHHPFTSLIYPVPEPGGLGVHLTLDLAGQARFGPDVEWIESVDFSVDPGRARVFAEGIRQWWPDLDESRLQPAYAGIRPKLAGPDGGFADFRIDGEQDHGIPGLVHLFGIESPGLTACLAIADEVAEKLGD